MQLGDIQCTAIVYVDDLLVSCNDEATIAGIIKALKVWHHEGLVSGNVPRHVGSQIAVTLSSDTLFMINETCRKLFLIKVAQQLYID